MIVHANLDQETRWSGLGLPAHVRRRISAVGALAAVLAPEGEPVELYTPAPVDPARLHLGRAVSLHTGIPARAELAWARGDAKAVNDRRFALALGFALPGAAPIASRAQLETFAWPARWVAKAVWTAAGRDRARGEGPPTGELFSRVANLVARAGAVVVEPWLDRVTDLGVAGATGQAMPPPHTLQVDARGGFLGIDSTEPALESPDRERLAAAYEVASRALTAAGYSGPFTLDAFTYRTVAGTVALHPLCELNARYTFGHVARALGHRLLGFGEPPPGARMLVSPLPDDPTTAWVG